MIQPTVELASPASEMEQFPTKPAIPAAAARLFRYRRMCEMRICRAGLLEPIPSTRESKEKCNCQQSTAGVSQQVTNAEGGRGACSQSSRSTRWKQCADINGTSRTLQHHHHRHQHHHRQHQHKHTTTSSNTSTKRRNKNKNTSKKTNNTRT